MYGNTYMSKLLADVLVDLPPAAQNLLVEFEDLYKHLGTDFSLSDMDSISCPVGIKDQILGSRKI